MLQQTMRRQILLNMLKTKIVILGLWCKNLAALLLLVICSGSYS